MQNNSKTALSVHPPGWNVLNLFMGSPKKCWNFGWVWPPKGVYLRKPPGRLGVELVEFPQNLSGSSRRCFSCASKQENIGWPGVSHILLLGSNCWCFSNRNALGLWDFFGDMGDMAGKNPAKKTTASTRINRNGDVPDTHGLDCRVRRVAHPVFFPERSSCPSFLGVKSWWNHWRSGLYQWLGNPPATWLLRLGNHQYGLYLMGKSSKISMGNWQFCHLWLLGKWKRLSVSFLQSHEKMDQTEPYIIAPFQVSQLETCRLCRENIVHSILEQCST